MPVAGRLGQLARGVRLPVQQGEAVAYGLRCWVFGAEQALHVGQQANKLVAGRDGMGWGRGGRRPL